MAKKLLKINKNKSIQRTEKAREKLVNKYINKIAIKSLLKINKASRKGKYETMFVLPERILFYGEVEYSIIDEALKRYIEFMNEKNFKCKEITYSMSPYRYLNIAWREFDKNF